MFIYDIKSYWNLARYTDRLYKLAKLQLLSLKKKTGKHHEKIPYPVESKSFGGKIVSECNLLKEKTYKKMFLNKKKETLTTAETYLVMAHTSTRLWFLDIIHI